MSETGYPCPSQTYQWGQPQVFDDINSVCAWAFRLARVSIYERGWSHSDRFICCHHHVFSSREMGFNITCFCSLSNYAFSGITWRVESRCQISFMKRPYIRICPNLLCAGFVALSTLILETSEDIHPLHTVLACICVLSHWRDLLVPRHVYSVTLWQMSLGHCDS